MKLYFWICKYNDVELSRKGKIKWQFWQARIQFEKAIRSYDSEQYQFSEPFLVILLILLHLPITTDESIYKNI
jgi:hypothetical protein